METIVVSNVAFCSLTIRSSTSVSWLTHQTTNQESSSSSGAVMDVTEQWQAKAELEKLSKKSSG